jgi:hypothetical protein
MKALTKILIGFFVCTISTSSSNTKGQIKIPPKNKEYKLEFNKEKVCSKDKYLEKQLKELEKEHIRFVELKDKVKTSYDSSRIAIK